MTRRELGPAVLRIGGAVEELPPASPVIIGVSGGTDSMAPALGTVWVAPHVRSEVKCIVVDRGL